MHQKKAMDNQLIYNWLKITYNWLKIDYSLLMRKSTVTPKKYVTIPHLELVAAVLSVKITALIRRKLDIEWKNKIFCTDSKVVLGYINNNAKKFKIFVANQIKQKHEGSNASQ